MINILNQFNKNYQMKTIKTYIQARRHKFSNNGGGLGSLVVVVVDFLNFFLVVVLITGLMMADRHPTGCRSPSLLCNGKMPVGEYWSILLCADWEKLMVAIGINPS